MSNKKKRNLLKEQESDSEDEEIKIPDKNAKTFYCIVPGCKEESVWSAKQSLLNHLNEHLLGKFKGTIPPEFFTQWNLTTCGVCEKFISASNSQGSHPNCRKNKPESSSTQPALAAPLKLMDMHSHPFLQALTWKRIFKLEAVTVSYLPKSIAGRWGSILCSVLQSVIHRKETNSWKLFFLLPRLVLRMPKRGGKNKFVNVLDKGMKRWQAGDLEGLFLEAERTTIVKRVNNKHNNFKRTFRLCTLGRYSDALNALEELEFVTENAEIFYPSGSMFKRGLFPLEMKVVKGGIIMLGAPIGSQKYISSFLDKKHNDLDLLLARLRRASSSIGSQCTYLLLSKCLSFGKLVFHARTVHPSAVVKHAVKYDQLIQDCFSLILPGLTEDELTQCTFPLKDGGLGLRKLSGHCVPAFLASSAVALKFLKTDFTSADSHWNLSALLETFNAEILDADKIKWSAIESQRSLSARIEKYQIKQFATALSGTDKHRFNALDGELSSAWLTALLDFNNRLTSLEFETAVRLRIGAHVYEDESVCDFCGGKRAVDRKGLHALVCKGGGDRIARHNVIRDLMLKLCTEAAFSVTEKRGMQVTAPDCRR